MNVVSFRALDLNLLKVFEALMTEGSVTRAASALTMTQPAVSNALARLRDALGDPLFVRSGTGIRPTQRAVVLWEPIGEALESVRGALDEQVFDPGRAQTEFTLSMSDYVAALVMPDLHEPSRQGRAKVARPYRSQHHPRDRRPARGQQGRLRA